MDHIINELYSRQKDLSLEYCDQSALVIGLGGVGSWAALDLALLGMGTLILIDPDKVEASNLNRTLFKLTDIGRFKTHAVKDLICERRPDCIVLTIEEYFNLEHFRKYEVSYVFDCTDNLNSREILKGQAVQYVKCGYDGFNGTLSFNDFESGKWGDEGSYTIVPSFFGTPQVLAALAVIEMVIEGADKRTINFDVKDIVNYFTEN